VPVKPGAHVTANSPAAKLLLNEGTRAVFETGAGTWKFESRL